MDTESKNMYIHTRIHVYAGGHTYIYIYIYTLLSAHPYHHPQILFCAKCTHRTNRTHIWYICMEYVCGIYVYMDMRRMAISRVYSLFVVKRTQTQF